MLKLFLLSLLLVSIVFGQTSERRENEFNSSEFQKALIGSWVGVLEYRDFAEPATSNKRVKLPTWLTVEATGGSLRFRYVYDDGPSKTVTETSLVTVDSTTSRYIVAGSEGKVEDSYAISDLMQLHRGLGTLTLNGTGTENKMPVKVRTTIRIGRNLLEITRETGASNASVMFRHAYTLVRAAPSSENK